MRVNCPECKASLPSSAVNLERLIAKCDDCDLLFDCSDQLPSPGTSLPAKRQRWREPVPLPEGMHIEVTGGGDSPLAQGYRSESPTVTGSLAIQRRWLPSAKGLGFRSVFAVAWWSFLVFWYSAAIGDGAWFAIIFPIGHVAVGVWLVYSILSDLLNSSLITADASTLAIRHTPLWARGAKRLPVSSLEQLYCKETKHTSNGEHGSSTSYSYSVCARLTDGTQIPLLEKLADPDQALFIEQQLEAHLGIIDEPVGGEYRP